MFRVIIFEGTVGSCEFVPLVLRVYCNEILFFWNAAHLRIYSLAAGIRRIVKILTGVLGPDDKVVGMVRWLSFVYYFFALFRDILFLYGFDSLYFFLGSKTTEC